MRKLFFILLIAVYFASCETAEFIQHTPALVNTGQHTARNQFTGRALYSTGSSTSNSVQNSQGASPYQSVNGFQAQGSYSVSKSLALQSSYMHSAEKGGSEESGNKTIVYNYDRNMVETGLAFFTELSAKKSSFFEMGAGIGFGSYKATEKASVLLPGGRFYDHNVFKFYLQPSAYYATKNLHFSTGFKLSFLSFTGIETNYTVTERNTRGITADNKLSTSVMDYFFRAEAFPGKMPWLGLSTQFLFSTELGDKFHTNMNDNNFGIGLCFRFGNMTGDKK